MVSWILYSLLDLIGYAMGHIMLAIVGLFTHTFDPTTVANGGVFSGPVGTMFPVIWQFYDLFKVLGMMICSIICVIQLFKSFFGPLFDAESPIALALRTVFYMALTLSSATVCQIVVGISTSAYNAAFDLSKDGLSMSLLDNLNIFEQFNNLGAGASIASVGAPLLLGFIAKLTANSGVIVFLFIAAMWGLLKRFLAMCVEVVERYVILMFLQLIAPLCISTGASKATCSIFHSWFKMLISQGILMTFSMFFMGSFCNGFAVWIGTFNSWMPVNPFFGYLILVAWLEIAVKIDSYLARMGMSVAEAGNLSSAAMGVFNSGTGAANLAVNAATGSTYGEKGSWANPLQQMMAAPSVNAAMEKSMARTGGSANGGTALSRGSLKGMAMNAKAGLEGIAKNSDGTMKSGVEAAKSALKASSPLGGLSNNAARAENFKNMSTPLSDVVGSKAASALNNAHAALHNGQTLDGAYSQKAGNLLAQNMRAGVPMSASEARDLAQAALADGTNISKVNSMSPVEGTGKNGSPAVYAAEVETADGTKGIVNLAASDSGLGMQKDLGNGLGVVGGDFDSKSDMLNALGMSDDLNNAVQSAGEFNAAQQTGLNPNVYQAPITEDGPMAQGTNGVEDLANNGGVQTSETGIGAEVSLGDGGSELSAHAFDSEGKPLHWDDAGQKLMDTNGEVYNGPVQLKDDNGADVSMTDKNGNALTAMAQDGVLSFNQDTGVTDEAQALNDLQADGAKLTDDGGKALTVGNDGLLYGQDDDGKLAAYSGDICTEQQAAERFMENNENPVSETGQALEMAADGTLQTVDGDGNLNPYTGAIMDGNSSGALNPAPMQATDGSGAQVVVGNDDNALHKVNDDGSVQSDVYTGGVTGGLQGTNGEIVAKGADGQFHSVNDGKLSASAYTGAITDNSSLGAFNANAGVPMSDNMKPVQADKDGTLHEVNADGSLSSEAYTGGIHGGLHSQSGNQLVPDASGQNHEIPKGETKASTDVYNGNAISDSLVSESGHALAKDNQGNLHEVDANGSISGNNYNGAVYNKDAYQQAQENAMNQALAQGATDTSGNALQRGTDGQIYSSADAKTPYNGAVMVGGSAVGSVANGSAANMSQANLSDAKTTGEVAGNVIGNASEGKLQNSKGGNAVAKVGTANNGLVQSTSSYTDGSAVRASSSGTLEKPQADTMLGRNAAGNIVPVASMGAGGSLKDIKGQSLTPVGYAKDSATGAMFGKAPDGSMHQAKFDASTQSFKSTDGQTLSNVQGGIQGGVVMGKTGDGRQIAGSVGADGKVNFGENGSENKNIVSTSVVSPDIAAEQNGTQAYGYNPATKQMEKAEFNANGQAVSASTKAPLQDVQSIANSQGADTLTPIAYNSNGEGVALSRTNQKDNDGNPIYQDSAGKQYSGDSVRFVSSASASDEITSSQFYGYNSNGELEKADKSGKSSSGEQLSDIHPIANTEGAESLQAVATLSDGSLAAVAPKMKDGVPEKNDGQKVYQTSDGKTVNEDQIQGMSYIPTSAIDPATGQVDPSAPIGYDVNRSQIASNKGNVPTGDTASQTASSISTSGDGDNPAFTSRDTGSSLQTFAKETDGNGNDTYTPVFRSTSGDGYVTGDGQAVSDSASIVTSVGNGQQFAAVSRDAGASIQADAYGTYSMSLGDGSQHSSVSTSANGSMTWQSKPAEAQGFDTATTNTSGISAVAAAVAEDPSTLPAASAMTTMQTGEGSYVKTLAGEYRQAQTENGSIKTSGGHVQLEDGTSIPVGQVVQTQDQGPMGFTPASEGFSADSAGFVQLNSTTPQNIGNENFYQGQNGVSYSGNVLVGGNSDTGLGPDVRETPVAHVHDANNANTIHAVSSSERYDAQGNLDAEGAYMQDAVSKQLFPFQASSSGEPVMQQASDFSMSIGSAADVDTSYVPTASLSQATSCLNPAVPADAPDSQRYMSVSDNSTFYDANGIASENGKYVQATDGEGNTSYLPKDGMAYAHHSIDGVPTDSDGNIHISANSSVYDNQDGSMTISNGKEAYTLNMGGTYGEGSVGHEFSPQGGSSSALVSYQDLTYSNGIANLQASLQNAPDLQQSIMSGNIIQAKTNPVEFQQVQAAFNTSAMCPDATLIGAKINGQSAKFMFDNGSVYSYGAKGQFSAGIRTQSQSLAGGAGITEGPVSLNPAFSAHSGVVPKGAMNPMRTARISESSAPRQGTKKGGSNKGQRSSKGGSKKKKK